MEIARIVGANVDLGKPKDWDDSKGTCASLPVRLEEGPLGRQMVSAWKPSVEELQILKVGGVVTLCVFGDSHPPVWVGVDYNLPAEGAA